MRKVHLYWLDTTQNLLIMENVLKVPRNTSILLKETRVCVCVCVCVCGVCVCVFAKLDQFLPVRSQFDSNQHVNSVRIATFQSANFGPLLFAFYCPLLFYENKN